MITLLLNSILLFLSYKCTDYYIKYKSRLYFRNTLEEYYDNTNIYKKKSIYTNSTQQIQHNICTHRGSELSEIIVVTASSWEKNWQASSRDELNTSQFINQRMHI